ncbi:S8 family peptidase [Caenimonas aquaedulcis]|uniref:S8 family serine peptidase n=1 Tax=Caenimonas aquaedulcis TaxID=2793270 RepID=A0A931H8H4_9BURK|nr:S8 family serine peptidase [Caenimonas aquaedulcis]MBG9390666.1 S8 family serine peptidase [Caenimonas aquaedulcis]
MIFKKICPPHGVGFRALLMAFALLLCGANSIAASVDPQEYLALQDEAVRLGAVRVMVNLDDAVSLGSVATSKARLQQAANSLRAELGTGAWKAGTWSNDAGQIGVNVTPQGLATLLNSKGAKSFTRDPTDKLRHRILAADGRLQAIEAAIASTGFADVEMALDVDADLDYLGDGSIAWRDAPAASAQAQAVRASLLAGLRPSAALRQAPGSAALAAARIGREDFLLLREHPRVRSLQLGAWSDPRPADWQREVIDEARVHGVVDALIELRLPSPFVMGRGFMPDAAWRKQSASLRRALEEVVANIPGAAITRDLSEWGALNVRLDPDAAIRLFANADRRVLRVSLNRADAFPLLGVSEASINMQSGWNQNYRGAGQHIVLLDTGIRKSHAFFQMNGASKVMFEGCWGTNGGGYTSPCPAQDAKGDSPLNFPASGAPPAGCSSCPQHGTHAAGIAAGRQNAAMPKSAAGATLQGVAPDAFLISAQVFSLDAAGNPGSFRDDQIAALQALSASATDATYVALLNFGDSGKNTADCPNINYTMTNLVADLHSRGIPVVAGAGNTGATLPRMGISFPACIPYVIKVPGTVNNANGNSVANGSSIAADTFTGPMLLAPGYDILSSTGTSDTSTNQFGGTSFSGPHVAGYYAAIKAAVPTWTLADATAWIYSTGSVSAPQTYSGVTYPFRRIRMP